MIKTFMPSPRTIALVVLILVLMDGTPVVAQVPEQDLPLEHWSYSAVRSLVDTPLLEEKDLSFAEGSTITRFEMALLVSRILNRLEKIGDSGDNGPNDPEVWLKQLFEQAKRVSDAPTELTSLHMDAIRRLIDGFDDELETLGLAKRFLPSDSTTELIRYDSSLANPGDGSAKDKEEKDPFSLKDKENYLVGDNVIRLNDRMQIEASVLARSRAALDGDSPGSIGTIGGSVRVTPDFLVSGEYAGNASKESSGTDAVNVGALWQLGDVELGAKYRSVKPGFDSLLGVDLAEQGKTRGYDFTVRVGDVLIRTSRDTVDSLDNDLAGLQTVHSMGVSYDLAKDTVIRADYSYSDTSIARKPDPLDPPEEPPLDEPGREESKARRRTAIGVGVDTPKGSLELGLKYEGDSELGAAKLGSRGASAGVKYPVPWAQETVLQADVSMEEGAGQSSTSLSLGFVFRKDTSLLVGYKMIDFDRAMREDEAEDTTSDNVATAEFSIRF